MGELPKKTHGVELAIVGSWQGSSVNRYAEHVLSGARMAGLHDGHVHRASRAPRGRHDRPKGVRQAGAEHLSFVTLDCELRGLTEDSLHEAIQLIRSRPLVTGAVIYTGAWFWAVQARQPRLGPSHVCRSGTQTMTELSP